jgi:succinate-semialdehyde dehydrogenase/glutarate-semialdehyde dehydrogenase
LYAAQYFEWFSGEATRLDGETIHASEYGNRIYTIREPIGVVGLITPWNWPIGMVTRKVGPAIAAGCTVVLKSPGETPLTSAAMMVLGERAGIPPGVVNIVTALHNTVDVGRALTESPVVKKVSFTGSTRVGKILMKQSAGTLKKLSFELGGNAPFIVFGDADLDAAVAGAVACKFRSSGQTCICANRIYVHSSIYGESTRLWMLPRACSDTNADAFTRAFAEQVSKFTIGPGTRPGVTHGPLIHDRAMAKAKEHTEDAIQKGGKLLLGGHAIPELGPQFFQLTVIRDASADMKIAHEETFGPIAAIFSFDSEDEVIERANDSDVGLAGYFYSQDVHRCYRVAEALEVGMVSNFEYTNT